MKIAVQGIQGSFSEMAGHEYARQQRIQDYQLDYLISSENVLRAIEQGNCDVGIFALENSTGGVVTESIYALAAHQCYIDKMFSILVIQNLFAQPGVKKNGIREIHSHQQALRQCRHYLQDHFPQAKLVEAEDTAYAAEQLARQKDQTHVAVIGNKACAQLYGLQLLDERINDLKDNQTLFIAASQLKEK